MAKKVLDINVGPKWENTERETANILAKEHRQHSERKGNELKRSVSKGRGLHLNRIVCRKCLTD